MLIFLNYSVKKVNWRRTISCRLFFAKCTNTVVFRIMVNDLRLSAASKEATNPIASHCWLETSDVCAVVAKRNHHYQLRHL